MRQKKRKKKMKLEKAPKAHTHAWFGFMLHTKFIVKAEAKLATVHKINRLTSGYLAYFVSLERKSKLCSLLFRSKPFHLFC